MPIVNHSSPRPQEIAAIDLGSNSFHMVVARVVDNSIQVLSRLKQRVRLADGLDENYQLSEEAIARGVAALTLFAERLQGFAEENVTIVGTHTLRVACNATEFLQRAANVLPYPIEIISGHEEARLIFMGVEHTQSEQGRKLVIDIGGGSTELIIGENFEPLLLDSFNMGCVSFLHRFFPQGEISRQNFERAKQAAAQKIESICWQYRLQGWDYAIGASGTIKAVHEILCALGEKAHPITADHLHKLSEKVLSYQHIDDLALPGISQERKAVFAPGLAILCGLFDALAIRELFLSEGALREGVIYEIEGRFRHQDIRQRTAQSLATQYNIDHQQARRVLATTRLLYEQWAEANPRLVKKPLQALLEWAALLHETGLGINHTALQRHSAYILQHSNLPGFNQEQQLMLATLVRFHRKAIKTDDIPRFNLFKKKHYLPLIQILRLAILLNNQRQATVAPSSLQLLTDDNHWTLVFPSGFLTQNLLVQLDLEKEQHYWAAVPGWKLKIKEAATPS